MTDKLLPDTIAPEGLQVAEVYLASGGDSKAVSDQLGMSVDQVDAQLKLPEVRAYVNRQYNEAGFRNKFKMAGLLDAIINQKIKEMQDTDLGSSMDIMDILKIAHKFKMDETKAEIELEKARGGAVGKQTNVQINTGHEVSDSYANLIGKLAG